MKKQSQNTERLSKYSYFLLTAMTALLPLSFWKGFENNFDLVKSIVFNTFGGILLIVSMYTIIRNSRKKDYYLRVIHTLDSFFVLYIVSIGISAMFSMNLFSGIYGSYDRQMGLLFFMNIFCLFFLSGEILTDDKKINGLLFAIETSVFIIALFPVVESLGLNPFGLRPGNFTRPFSPEGHPVFTAGIINMALPLSVLNVTGKKNVILKYLYPSVMCAGIIFTLTRTAYAALVVQFIIIFLVWNLIIKPGKFGWVKVLKYSFYTLALVTVLVIFVIYAVPGNTISKRLISITTLTSQPRWYLWKDSFEMFKDYMLTGTGPGNFSSVFENYSSYALKLTDVRSIYDNAHNNFINTFCTTGIFGGMAYIAMLAYLLFISFRLFNNRKLPRTNRIFFLSVFCVFLGYIIYSLADFDDITIIFYFFIFAAVFRAKVFISDFEIIKPGRIKLNYSVCLILLVILTSLSVYNIYNAGIRLLAESEYSGGIKVYNSNFSEFESRLLKAVNLQPEQTQYRYRFASYLFDYCTKNQSLPPSIKTKLLEKAKTEILISQNKYISKLKCMELFSLIELEEGNRDNAFKIRDEIFKTDTCRFSYRNNLAAYYLKNNEDSLALKEIQLILKYDPKGIEPNVTYAEYLERRGDYKKALEVCRMICEINPDNQFAKNSIIRLSVLINREKK